MFAEVKCRHVPAAPGRDVVDHRPLAALGHRQRARLRRAATAWLADSRDPGLRADLIRFDAIGVSVDARDRLLAVEHVQGAW